MEWDQTTTDMPDICGIKVRNVGTKRTFHIATTPDDVAAATDIIFTFKNFKNPSTTLAPILKIHYIEGTRHTETVIMNTAASPGPYRFTPKTMTADAATTTGNKIQRSMIDYKITFTESESMEAGSSFLIKFHSDFSEVRGVCDVWTETTGYLPPVGSWFWSCNEVTANSNQLKISEAPALDTTKTMTVRAFARNPGNDTAQTNTITVELYSSTT
jgi:hypothetical protein